MYCLDMKRSENKSQNPDASDMNHEAYKDGCHHYNQGNFKKAKNAFSEAIGCYVKVSAQSTTYRAAQINMERAKNGNPAKNS
jgi:outer membrane protein assembly factor BamD (BamD/ComL family)